MEITSSHKAGPGSHSCFSIPSYPESNGSPSPGTCYLLPVPASLGPALLAWLNYSNDVLHRVWDFCLLCPPLCPQHLENLLKSLLHGLTSVFPPQVRHLPGFLPRVKPPSCLKPFPYNTEFQLPSGKNSAFQSLALTHPPVSPPVPMPLAPKAHWTAHSSLPSSASLPLSLFSPLHKMCGPTFALANTHQTVRCPVETDVLWKTNFSFLKYSAALGPGLGLQTPIIIPRQSIFHQTSAKVSMLFFLGSSTQQALSKCLLKWNENTV